VVLRRYGVPSGCPIEDASRLTLSSSGEVGGIKELAEDDRTRTLGVTLTGPILNASALAVRTLGVTLTGPITGVSDDRVRTLGVTEAEATLVASTARVKTEGDAI
jgi:hypothetical protein